MAQQLEGDADVISLRPNDAPVLFISHRHEDQAIADVLRRFIQSRTGGKVTVFQSSSTDARRLSPGRNIRDELRRELWHASVVVLIYTDHKRDWSNCMWECGVAQLPEPSKTKTVVLHCGDEFPSVFGDQLHTKVKESGEVEKFVSDLLTDADYFPQLGRAATEFVAGTPPVKEAAAELFQDLSQVLPIEQPDNEWPPCPQMTVKLTDDDTTAIQQATGTEQEKLAITRQVVLDNAMVVGGDGKISQIFGVQGFPHPPPPGVPLRRLIDSWEADSPTPSSGWIDDMCNQLRATVLDRFPTLRWRLMRGTDRQDNNWYGPLVRYVKKSPSRRCTEIDVVFCKFDLDADQRPRISVPEVLPEE